MQFDTIIYKHGDVACEANIAYDATTTQKRPCVIIFHAWHGPGSHELEKAEQLAELGYVGFVADVYGYGLRGDPQGDNSHLMGPFMSDRGLLRDRLHAAVDAARNHPLVDPDRIAVMGYCFGGLCALDLARSNAPGVRLAVSFHGVFDPPELGKQDAIASQVLICHGWDDPFAPPESLMRLTEELSAARAAWKLLAFGGVSHAFTNPAAASPEAGLQYDADADRASWRATVDCLAETLN